jgi:RHS repeat-associated protein
MNAVTGVESYLYDGNGRRTRTLNSTTGSIEYYGYGADGRLLQDWSNRRNVRNGYIYLGNTLVGLYEVNLTTGVASSRYKHTDTWGSPVVTTDATKAVLSRASYTPYGMPAMPVDGVGYTGHFMDVGTGLTYMQQRYYDPQIGRFLSVDPLGPGIQTGVNFSRYWYANNNPYRYIDPDGREVCDFDCQQERLRRAEESRPKGCNTTRPCSYNEDTGKWDIHPDPGAASDALLSPAQSNAIFSIAQMKNANKINYAGSNGIKYRVLATTMYKTAKAAGKPMLLVRLMAEASGGGLKPNVIKELAKEIAKEAVEGVVQKKSDRSTAEEFADTGQAIINQVKASVTPQYSELMDADGY